MNSDFNVGDPVCVLDGLFANRRGVVSGFVVVQPSHNIEMVEVTFPGTLSRPQRFCEGNLSLVDAVTRLGELA